MVITDRIVYIQNPKTACTHIGRFLESFFDGRETGKHQRLPQTLLNGERAVWGSVRNPWDWYVSLWAYGCGGKGGIKRSTTSSLNPLAIDRWRGRWIASRPHYLPLYSLNELKRPKGTWESVYSDNSVENFRKWLFMVLGDEHRYDLGEGYAVSPLSSLAGLATYRFVYFGIPSLLDLYKKQPFVDSSALASLLRTGLLYDYVIRTDRLSEDIKKAVTDHDGCLTEEAERWLDSAEKSNTSDRERDFRKYYDDESRALVASREKNLIDLFEFDF